ncbi:aminoglycoside phosphotransferase family protein [Actinomyces sp. 2119]|uniref:aminoglycoside phosphotransferase family protein n=1 Tax=Actinomyces sp. 2119 TaxID=2321393 RepID=UPI0021760EC8|nr:aminoglycoside phosphotransferase family protein [Actinomyces sp. 2119]
MDGARTLPALTGSADFSADFASRLEREARAGRVSGVEPAAVSVTRLGAGESFTAWLLRAEEAAQGARQPPRVVRVVRRPAEERPRSLRGEYEALSRVPPDLGSHGVALEEDSDNALGAPYVVTTYVPGRVVPGQEWTPRLACALAEQVARLHHLLGGAQTAGEGTAGSRLQPGQARHPGALREAEAVLGWWRSHHPDVLKEPRVSRLLAPWWRALVTLDPVTVGVPLHPLIHGDLVVTNVVVGTGGIPRLIDWEWAGPGDPAKDLALIGGEVTGGPWYAHLSRKAVTDMVSCYVAARSRLARSQAADKGRNLVRDCEGAGGSGEKHDEQVRRLLARRDAWELVDRLSNLLYCLSRRGQEDYLRWAGQLAESLGARLTAPPDEPPG